MRHLGVVGASWRRAGQALVAQLTPTGGAAAGQLAAMHRACGFVESCLIATCNRVEVVFVGAEGVDCATYRRRCHAFWLPQQPAERAAADLHAFAGEGAAERLFLVAAALDSLHPGEAQVLGQIKAAYQQAQLAGTIGPRLGRLFSEAFRVAKDVRARTGLGLGQVSMMSVAKRVIDERLAASASARLVVVGAGPMSQQCGALYAGRPGLRLTFVNRTLAGAAALAGRHGGDAQALTTFVGSPGRLDALLTATAAPAPLFCREVLGRMQGRPTLVDLNVGRDVQPAAAAACQLPLWDIDRLGALTRQNMGRRQEHLAAAREVVDAALARLARQQVERALAASVVTLRQSLHQGLVASLPGLPAPPCPMSEQERADWQAALSAWAARTARALAHPPTCGLKEVGWTHGVQVAGDFARALAPAARLALPAGCQEVK